MARKLTKKQKMFVEEYLVDLNATQAAIRAGYSEKTARQIGCDNLTKPNIQEEISKRINDKKEKLEISQNKIIMEYAKIAFADMKDFVQFDENGVRIRNDSEVDGRVISEVSEVETNYGETIRRTKKIKLHDKMKALEMLGRYLAIFDLEQDKYKLREREVEARLEEPEGNDGSLEALAEAIKMSAERLEGE